MAYMAYIVTDSDEHRSDPHVDAHTSVCGSWDRTVRLYRYCLYSDNPSAMVMANMHSLLLKVVQAGLCSVSHSAGTLCVDVCVGMCGCIRSCMCAGTCLEITYS